MKIGITISDLSEHQWETMQRVTRIEYEIPPRAVRVCALFQHGDEERHVEMPLQMFVAVAGLLEREGYVDLTPRKTGWPYDRYGPAPVPTTPTPINDMVTRINEGLAKVNRDVEKALTPLRDRT